MELELGHKKYNQTVSCGTASDCCDCRAYKHGISGHVLYDTAGGAVNHKMTPLINWLQDVFTVIMIPKVISYIIS